MANEELFDLDVQVQTTQQQISDRNLITFSCFCSVWCW
jgi:hypothetical protein